MNDDIFLVTPGTFGNLGCTQVHQYQWSQYNDGIIFLFWLRFKIYLLFCDLLALLSSRNRNRKWQCDYHLAWISSHHLAFYNFSLFSYWSILLLWETVLEDVNEEWPCLNLNYNRIPTFEHLLFGSW